MFWMKAYGFIWGIAVLIGLLAMAADRARLAGFVMFCATVLSSVALLAITLDLLGLTRRILP